MNWEVPKKSESKEEKMEYIGRVNLNLEKGMVLQWLDGEKPRVKEGESFILKSGDINVLKITIGEGGDIIDPVEYEWLSKDVPPRKEGMEFSVYKIEKI